MNKFTTSVVCGFCIFGLVGCAGTTNQDVGTVTGGVLGGVLGSQFGGGSGRIAAAVGGTLIGAYLGNVIGKNMDDTDRLRMTQALEQNRSQQSTSWSNPDTGNTYTVTPTRTYYNPANQPCREYSTTAIIGGKRQQVYGTACRTAGGNWKIMN